MAHETVKAGPRGDAETDFQNAACLAACSAPNTAHDESGQGDLSSRSASPTAIGAARDLIFEGLIETALLLRAIRGV